MEIILIGIATSWATKLINKLNSKLLGTSLEGLGAFILAFIMAIIASVVKVFWIDKTPFNFSTSYEILAPVFAQVWTTSQLYFTFISKKLNGEKKIDDTSEKTTEKTDLFD